MYIAVATTLCYCQEILDGELEHSALPCSNLSKKKSDIHKLWRRPTCGHGWFMKMQTDRQTWDF